MNPNFLKVIRVCARRWYVVLPILAVSVWYAFGYYTSIKPVYYANAVVAATSSNEQVPYTGDGRPVARNGLLDIGGASFIMNMVVLGFDDPGIRAGVVEGGGKGNFTARMFPSPAGAVQAPLPLIMIEATEPDAVSATKTVELAANQVDLILAGVQGQAGVPESQMVRAIKASTPKAVVGIPSRNKTTILIIAFGAGIAILAALGLDALIRWQSHGGKPRRRAKAPGQPGDIQTVR